MIFLLAIAASPRRMNCRSRRTTRMSSKRNWPARRPFQESALESKEYVHSRESGPARNVYRVSSMFDPELPPTEMSVRLLSTGRTARDHEVEIGSASRL